VQKKSAHSIYKCFFMAESLEDFLGDCIDILSGPTSSSSRLVLFEKSNNKIELGFYRGTKHEIYAYLDMEIIRQLQDRSRLFIPDSSKFRNIKFSPGKQYPQSILGFSFEIDPKLLCVYWEAYDRKKEISKSEVEFYETALSIMALGIKKLLVIDEDQKELAYLKAISSRVQSPILLIDQSFTPLYSNRAGDRLLKEINAVQKNDIHSFIQRLVSGNDNIFENLGVHYHIQIHEIQMVETYQMIILNDDTNIEHQNETMRMIINVSNQILRSRITEALGYAKMMPLIGELNPKQREYIEKININFGSLLTEIDDLYELGRITRSNGIRVNLIEPYSLVDESIQLNRAEAIKNRVTIEVNMDELKGSEIFADPTLCRQAFYEVIKFAVQQTGMGRAVHIYGMKKSEKLSISIKDSGKGFSPMDVEKFPNVDTQDSDLKNLILVSKILNYQDIQFNISSKLGEGSEYLIVFTQKNVEISE